MLRRSSSWAARMTDARRTRGRAVSATRRLPFDTAPSAPEGGVEREADWEVQRRERAERKALLNRIAMGDFSWPSGGGVTDGEDLRGTALAQSEGVRSMVGRLLVRDPRHRSRVAELWADEWIHGPGAPPPPVLDSDGRTGSATPSRRGSADDAEVLPIVVSGVDGREVAVEVDADPEVDVDVEGRENADAEGVLVDGEDIGPGHVARQEH